MGRNLKLVTAVVVLLLVVGVLVWPTPRPACAAVSVQLFVSWDQEHMVPRDLHPVVELLHSDGSPFVPAVTVQLQDNWNHTWFTGSVANPPSQAALAEYSWDVGGDEQWFKNGDAIDVPHQTAFNWSGTILTVSVSVDI